LSNRCFCRTPFSDVTGGALRPEAFEGLKVCCA
jgi:hypothetical protein